MKIKQHERLTEIVFGKKGTEVHKFLDRYSFEFGNKSRIVFHHKQGLDMIKILFGEEIKEIAELHIRCDFYGRVPNLKELENYENKDFPIKDLHINSILGGIINY